MITEQHQHVQVLKLDLHSDPVVMQAIEPLMKTEQQQHAAATHVLKREICCNLGVKQVAVPVMKSSVMRRSKKLSNWLSRRLARARISIFLSGLPVSAISSSTTAANLKQCDESEVIQT